MESVFQGGHEAEDERTDDEEEDGVTDEVIVGITKNLAKGNAKCRPYFAQPVKGKPEDCEQDEDGPAVAQAGKRNAG